MSAQAVNRLQGLYDILPPPIIKEADWMLFILLACLAAAVVLAWFVWRHWRNTKLQRCRRQYRRLKKCLDKLSSSEAGETLHRILLTHLGLVHLDQYSRTTRRDGISSEEWQTLVSVIYRARFSGRDSTELQPAMRITRRMLWNRQT